MLEFVQSIAALVAWSIALGIVAVVILVSWLGAFVVENVSLLSAVCVVLSVRWFRAQGLR